MGRPIDADALIDDLAHGMWGKDWDKALAEAIIRNAPTIDAVPVVRCGECKWYEAYKSECWLHLDAKAWLPNDFCSDGERKEEDGR